MDAIEEQYSRVDAGGAALQRARQTIRRLRSSLPAHLLENARRENGGRWEWTTLAEVSSTVVDCEHWTPHFVSKGQPCVDTTCISPGEIHRERLRYVDEATFQRRVRRLIPQAGDVVFAREGTVGTAVTVPADLHICLGQRVMLFRPDPAAIDGDFMSFMMNADVVKQQYRPRILGTTAPHLNVRDAKALRVPVPPLSVQQSIVAKAQALGAVFALVDTALGDSTVRAAALRSSVLAYAFAGKLLSQDRRDELAEVHPGRVTADCTVTNHGAPSGS